MVLVVGDRIDFTYYHLRLKKWTSIQGPIVKIIHQGGNPFTSRDGSILQTETWRQTLRSKLPALWDRLVIVKESGGFFIISTTPVNVYNRLFKME